MKISVEKKIFLAIFISIRDVFNTISSFLLLQILVSQVCTNELLKLHGVYDCGNNKTFTSAHSYRFQPVWEIIVFRIDFYTVDANDSERLVIWFGVFPVKLVGFYQLSFLACLHDFSRLEIIILKSTYNILPTYKKWHFYRNTNLGDANVYSSGRLMAEMMMMNSELFLGKPMIRNNYALLCVCISSVYKYFTYVTYKEEKLSGFKTDTYKPKS